MNIKNYKDLVRLPSGNFLDTRTRIVYSKSVIEKLFAEELQAETATQTTTQTTTETTETTTETTSKKPAKKSTKK